MMPANANCGLDHPRSGELVAISRADSWFTYYYFLDEARAPDFARTVDIHRKPGYDPVELFIDPQLRAPKARIGMAIGPEDPWLPIHDGCHLAGCRFGEGFSWPSHGSAEHGPYSSVPKSELVIGGTGCGDRGQGSDFGSRVVSSTQPARRAA
jgi:hypothetical protein